MEITSTPFIRNDYWGDYNDLSQINNRIDNLESDMDLMNINLSTDIENVSNNLNTYINSQADTTTTNNIVVNNINANYAEGNYANFDNTFTNNAYIENLTVNKPVFDITLNTPHMENITVTSGNIYNTNLFNVAVENISGTITNSTITDSTLTNAVIDGNGVLGDVEINNAVINTANIDNLYINKSVEPVTSSAVLGYDITGKVIPVKATFDVAFPESANYLYTDEHGTAFAGTAETAVGESDNLVTAFAVANEFANMANTANEQYDTINNNFANIDNSFNAVNNDTNNIYDVINGLIGYLNLTSPATYYNSTNPVNYKSCTSVEYRTESNPTGTLISQNEFPWAVYMRVENNTLIYSSRYSPLQFGSDILYNENCSSIYNDCVNMVFTQPLNMQNVKIAVNAFAFCNKLNVPIDLSSATNLASAFRQAFSFNQPINLSSAGTEISNISYMFVVARNFNQPINLSSATGANARGAFYDCQNFNQPINLSSATFTDVSQMFFNCQNFNQPVNITGNITDVSQMFYKCQNFNQPDIWISHLPTNKDNLMRMFWKVNYIGNIHLSSSYNEVEKATLILLLNNNSVTGYGIPNENIFFDID